MELKKISCIIIEDKAVDAAYLESFVLKETLFDYKGSFLNAMEANAFVRTNQPQLIFMDIDMPIMSGMEYFKQLDPAPLCIFVTAHSEYAWEGFEAQAFDFILKPVKAERFNSSVERLKEYLALQGRADLYDSQIEENTISIKEGFTKHIIYLKDILYIEALKDYSKVVTADKKIMTLSKLKHFVDKLPPAQFTRVHRSYAVAINKIEKVEVNDLFIRKIKIPVGKTFRNGLKTFL
jgi:DNA-binding LytR/AlgR family response regulator